jgi:ABC-type multidrug transport system ATPase subunit
MAMIQIKDVTKTYRDLTAVRDLNLTIDKGDVFGFIGPNGAGKTTTIKILATLLEPSTGQAMSMAWTWCAIRSKCAASSATCPTSSASMMM